MSKIDEKTTIPLGLLITIVTGFGGFWGYCEVHFAKASDVETMQGEIHQIYEKIIPEAQREGR